MKTKEELTALKTEVQALNKKLAELTDDELAEVTGGICKSEGICPANLTCPDYSCIFRKCIFCDRNRKMCSLYHALLPDSIET